MEIHKNRHKVINYLINFRIIILSFAHLSSHRFLHAIKRIAARYAQYQTVS